MLRKYILYFFCFSLLLWWGAAESAHGQAVSDGDSIAAAWSDSLAALSERFTTWKYEGNDTLSNPYYSTLFTAALYDAKRKSALNLAPRSVPGEGIFATRVLQRQQMMDEALDFVYGQKPWLVKNASNSRKAISESEPKVLNESQGTSNDDWTRAIEEANFVEPEVDIVVEKPNFWTFKTNFSFHLMQNYVTDNWYKGGESNHALLGQLIAEANFDNKRYLKFSNKLEMRLGFQSSSSDELHKYKTNSDLIRLTNEFSIKAWKNWEYSAMLQSWTQFYRGYKKNDPHVYSDFMSPFESLLTLGMKYSLKKKNIEFAINISPLAVDFKYVGRPSLVTAMGLKEGRHHKFEYGSNITATYKWTIIKNIEWNGRIYFYTSYKRAQIEWENTFHLRVNKYLSTQLFLYPRFDDGVKRADAETSYFQFKEYLSIGLDINF